MTQLIHFHDAASRKAVYIRMMDMAELQKLNEEIRIKRERDRDNAMTPEDRAARAADRKSDRGPQPANRYWLSEREYRTARLMQHYNGLIRQAEIPDRDRIGSYRIKKKRK